MRRTVIVASAALALALVVACGLLLYLHTAAGRRFLAAKVNQWVSRELVSELRIERIDVLSNDRLVISSAALLDAKGRPVLALKGLSARLDAWTILKNLFEPTARVELPEVHIEQFELGLYHSESGGVSLTEAFDTRPDPSKPRTANPTAGKGPRVLLPRVAIDRVSTRTDLSGLSQASADLHALTLSFDWSPELFALGIATDDARVTRALPLDARARLNGQLRIPGATDVTLAGTLGALPIQASFRAISGELALNLSSPALEPGAMRSLIPSWPLVVPVSARVEVVGRPSAMHAKIQALAGASRLDAEGPVTLSPHVKADLSVTANALDARLFASDVAQTALNAQAKLELAFDSAIHVALNARTAKAELFGAVLPETNFVAVYAEQQVTGTLSSADPVFPVGVDFHLSSDGTLGFHARAQAFDLAALAAYGVRAQGQSDLDVRGALNRGQLTAEFEARLGGLRIAPVVAPAALVRGKVRGAIAHPEQLAVELEAQGTKLALGPLEFPSWAIESKGAVDRQTVALRAGPESAPTLQGSTTLAFGSGVALGETRLQAELHGVKHAVELKSARVASSLVEFGGLHWQVGAGTLTGAGSLSPTRKLADLDLSGVEVRELLETLGMTPDDWGGRVTAAVHFEENNGQRRGQLKASLVGGVLPAVGAMDAAFDVGVVDSDIEGRGELIAPKLGLGKLALRGSLGQGPLSSLSLNRLVGELGLELSEVQLDEVSRRWLPRAGLALSGRAEASLRLARTEPNAAASVSYELKTRELGLRSQGSDGEGTLRHGELSSQGEIGENESHLRIELKDAAGPWIAAKVEHSVGLSELVRAFRSASPIELVDAPLRAEISARPRSLELLGGAVPRAFSGEVSAQLGITGNVMRPEIAASLIATGLGATGRDASGKLALNFDYSAAREEYSLTAHYANRARAKLEFNGEGHWSWIDHGFGRDWSAKGQAKIEKLELGPIAQLLGLSLTGQAAGQVALSASSSEFEATGKIDLRSLALEQQSLGDGSAQMRVHQGLAEAQLSMASGDSTLEFAGELGVCWDDGPCVDAKRGGSLDAKVRKFQLAAVAPLLRAVVSDIRGPVNGFMTLAWEPADATGKRDTRLRADAVVTDGSVTLTSGAGSIQCLALRARGDEERTLNLELSGCARVNKPNLEAKVRVLWNGPVPQRVEAELGPLKEVPVTFDGVMLGNATVTKGQPIRLLLELAGAQRAVEVDVRNLEFALPKKDDTSLVDLEDDPAIVVTDAKSPPVREAQTNASSHWSIAVKLGKAVKVTQSGMKVPVTGALTQGPDGLLDGNIILPEGGVVPQLGQIFRLKRGSVHFNHQPLKEGALSIEASTRTTDGVVVDLFVSGTIEKPLIRLRSDPPRSENDILALLLGVQGSDTVSTNGKQGADLRGSATALAMNQLLRGSALASLQFGAGQNHQGDSVSTVSMRAPGMDTVWLEGRTVRNSSQRAANSTVQASGVIDWRFARGFSLRTQLGNNVSGVELRWSHRY